MEGSRRNWKSPLEVERGFANSRLERQILVRAYELVVPVVRRSLTDPPPACEADDGGDLARPTKGA